MKSSSNPNPLNKIMLQKYLDLPKTKNKLQVTYVWIDVICSNLRCKTRTVDFEPKAPDDLPIWESHEPTTHLSTVADIFLKRMALFRDPFFGGRNQLVMREVYNSNNKPHCKDAN